jgi:hypothetical protein
MVAIIRFDLASNLLGANCRLPVLSCADAHLTATVAQVTRAATLCGRVARD